MRLDPRSLRRWATIGLACVAPAAESARTEQLGSQASVAVENCRVKFASRVQLAAERTGILAEVAAAGDRVTAGDVVAQLRDAVIRARLAVAEKEAANEIDVQYALKASQLAQLKYQRALQANRDLSGTVPEIELGELRLAAEKASLQIELAEHQRLVAMLKRDEIRETLGTMRVIAPTSALVRVVHKQPGEVIQEGEVVAELVDTQRIRVEAYVESWKASRIRAGQRVRVQLSPAANGRGSTSHVFEGRVHFVDIQVEPVSQKVLIWAELPNPQGLLYEGQIATMLIDTAAAVAMAR